MTVDIKTETDKKDAKRWLIIGAYQVGATDRQIAKLFGVSQASVRRIILNFQTTGSPFISKKLSQKETSKPYVEYDDQGNLIDSEDENEIMVKSTIRQKIKARRPTAKDLITYVLNKAQAEKINPTVVKQEEEKEKWRLPTPPRDQFHQHHHTYIPPSRTALSPPLSEPSVPIIKGFERWTMEEDKVLMAHVLTRLSGCRWHEAELKLKGRHKADECERRWTKLKSLLIKGAEKSGTKGW